MALIIMGLGAVTALAQGQAGLGAIQRLDLTFFVHAKDQRFLWRPQIEPDNRLQLLGEQGIVADFEAGYPVRLEPMTAPNASYARWADPRCLGHKSATPVRRYIRRAARRKCHDLLRLNNPWPPGAGLIGLQCLIEDLQKPTANAPAPLTRDPQRQSNRSVVCTLRRQ